MRRAFTLIEILVTVGIIAVLATVAFVALGPARLNARDTARKTQINDIGRFILASDCYVPNGGAGDYDLKTIYDEVVVAHPEAKQFLPTFPKDPKSGSDTVSGYRYLYDASGHCALYANYENADASIDLPSLTAVTAGGGTGTLKSSTDGVNGTPVFYQLSR